MKAIHVASVLALSLVSLGLQEVKPDLEKRVTALESRVAALEEPVAAPQGQQAQDAKSSIVSVRLTRKGRTRECLLLDYYNLVFDVEFTGTKLLGDRRIRDIKGTLYFDDAFGEEIIGATMTKRVGIGSGQKKLIDGLLIDYTTVQFSDKWKRVLTTDAAELRVRFVVDSVIYDDK